MDKLIELLKYIFFGAVQGITETLPISSSGHLVILNELLKLEQDKNLTFEIFLHFGSLIAIIIFYRKTIVELIKNFFSYLVKKDESAYTDFKYIWLLALASIPAGILGVLFKEKIEKHLLELRPVGIFLLVTALLLFIISRIPKGNKEKADVTWKDALIIGIFQAFAILPGISRSGSTVSASLGRKLKIDNALKFSFFLFIPVALGSALLDVYDFVKNPNTPDLIIPYLAAFFTTILFTYLALHIFIDVIKKGKLSYFSIYCAFMGTFIFILSFIL